MDKCVTCKYWDTVDQKNGLFGECRRNPPKIIEERLEDMQKGDTSYEGIYYATWFPVVRMNNMCGEWKAKS
jgi:hypothetical protein